MTTTKTRDEITQERAEERAKAIEAFGERSVEGVLYDMRTRLALLSELCMAQTEADGEMASDGWAGMDHTLQGVINDLKMLEDALPVDVTSRRPGRQ